MSYNSDNEKYGDFFNNYSPEKQRNTPSRYLRQPAGRPPQDRKKKTKRHLRPWVKIALAVIALGTVIALIALSVAQCSNSTESDEAASSQAQTASDITSNTTETDVTPIKLVNRPSSFDQTVLLGDQIESPYAVLVDCSNDTVLARRNADTKVYPASMTKVMTLLIAAENITDTEATFEMTSKIIDPLYKEGLTLAGFGPGEKVKLIDLFYGMVLESGAECSVALAEYVSGSEEEFVKLMNEKAELMGLDNTHFTNTSGLHDDNHYTTSIEMAMIMRVAIQNDFCRNIMSTEWYTVPKNEYHDELKFHSGMYEKMYGTEPQVATIKGGKTGFTQVSQFCLASFAVTDDGRDIICVTAKGERKYAPIYDCIKLYKDYTHPEN